MHRGGVGVIDGDVARPVGWDAPGPHLLRHLEEAAEGAAVETADRVHGAAAGLTFVEVPCEDAGVERGGADVRCGQIDP
jgi:hypothetical protein